METRVNSSSAAGGIYYTKDAAILQAALDVLAGFYKQTEEVVEVELAAARSHPGAEEHVRHAEEGGADHGRDVRGREAPRSREAGRVQDLQRCPFPCCLRWL